MDVTRNAAQKYGDCAACIISPKRARLLAPLGVPAWLLSGCAGNPSATIAGAYFPAWLLCALFAVVVALAVHVLIGTTGLAKYFPFQLAVCLSLGVIAALTLWHFWMAY